MLYRFHRSVLERHSIMMEAILSIPSGVEGDGSDEHPLWFHDSTVAEMDTLGELLYDP